ncbi:MAG: dihydrofolate reductase [Lewinellaceae bacterium]|nr:dihydrofolate reductase [Lewinellaceae bacterium]
MIVSAIVAMAQNRVIGNDQDIPWHLSGDLQFFKKTTLNHHVIMGRLTFQAIGRPLPKRTNIIVTRDPFFLANDCIVVHSVEEGLQIALDNGETEAFIIGGAQIYQQSMPYWDQIYLTQVEATVSGDAFFPEIDPSEWRQLYQQRQPADDRNDFPYTFKRFERITAPSAIADEEE